MSRGVDRILAQQPNLVAVFMFSKTHGVLIWYRGHELIHMLLPCDRLNVI